MGISIQLSGKPVRGFRSAKTPLWAILFLAIGCGQAASKGDLEGGQRGIAKMASVTVSQTPLLGIDVPMFVDQVPTFNGRRQDGTVTVALDMQEVQQFVLPASVYAGLPAPYNAGTYVWGYNLNGAGASWPARTIESRRNTTTTASYTNSLVNTHLQSLLTVDQSIHWADPLNTTQSNNCMNPPPFGPPLAPACKRPYSGPIPTVTHLHGNEVLSQYDGHAEAWFTPGLTLTGPAYVTNTYNYPNSQEATTLWFHDHALGIVRLNVYAGLAGFYLLRDNRDTGSASNPITLPAGNQEVELMIQDRQFDTNGQLYFPDSDNPANLNGPPANPSKHPYWVPEFFGDVITVNGKSWPVLDVEPRRYRIRWLNGSNARMYVLQMFDQSGLDMHVNGPAGPAIWQIGSDGGLFNNPVKLDDPASGNHTCDGTTSGGFGNNNDIHAGAKCLFLAPAERADTIIDFGGQLGKTFTLKNFAVIPFPSGGPVGFGVPDATADGLVMQFRVSKPLQQHGPNLQSGGQPSVPARHANRQHQAV